MSKELTNAIKEVITDLATFPAFINHYAEYLDPVRKFLEKQGVAPTIMIPFMAEAIDENSKLEGADIFVAIKKNPAPYCSTQGVKLGLTAASWDLLCTELIIKNSAIIKRDMKQAEMELRKFLQRFILDANVDSVTSINYKGVVKDPVAITIELINKLENLTWLSNRRGDEGLVNLFDSFNTSLGERIRLGIPPLDSIMRGGPALSSTVIISGPTNTGKSYLAQHCMLIAAQAGYSTALFSREDAVPLTRSRLLCGMLKKGEEEIEGMTEAQRAQACEEHFQYLNNKIPGEELGEKLRNGIHLERFGVDSMTPKEIEERLYKIEELTGRLPKYIVIDYLQCATANGGKKSDERRDSMLERFVRELEDVLVKTKTTAIIVSQAKGSQMGKDSVSLSAAGAESYAAIQACNYVIYIGRNEEEAKRLQNSPDKNPRQFVVLAKSKDTSLGGCYCLTTFTNSTWHFFKSEPERDNYIEATLGEYQTNSIFDN